MVSPRVLQSEFLKYGHIKKLYLEKFGNFAKVFYTEKESCDLAVQGLNNTSLNWQVQHFDNTRHSIETTPSRSLSSTSLSEAANMAGYNDYYDEEDFSENFDYCNIHGQPLVVLQADSGDLYVNLKDIRKTGFALFRRDNFNSVLVDKRQISKEFELHLLSEAQNYILKNRVASIDEEQILKTIERCKNKLIGTNNIHETRNNFGPGRTVQTTGKSNFVITSDNQHSTPNSKYPVSQTVNQRPPKSLSNSFGPSHTHHGVGPKQKGQEHKRNQSIGRETYNNVDTEYQRERNHAFSKPNSNQWEKNNESVKSTANQREKNEYHKTSTNQRSPNLNDSSSSESTHSRRPRNKWINKKFEIGETYAVHVAYAEKEKDNICWVQEQNDIKTIEELFLQINEIEADLESVDPVPGQCVIALYDGVWNRARVITANPLKVHFLDYGNKSEVEMVKSLPDELKRIPEFATRIAVNKIHNLNLSDNTEFTIKVKQQYDDGTYLVDVDDNNDNRKSNMVIKASESVESLEPRSERVVPPKEPLIEEAYFDIPKPMADLHDGDKVMIIDFEGDKFLVKTKQCAQKSKEITEYIKELDKSALMLTNVKVGQIVLCSKDGLIGLYRARVIKKDSASVVTVKYLDFSGEDDLSVKSLRNIDNYLATVPCSILFTPKIKGLDISDKKILEYVVNLCSNREKCTVVLSENNFDLKFSDGILISEKLNEIKNPKVEQETVKPSVQEETKPTVLEEAKPVVRKDKPPVQEDAKPPVVGKDSALIESKEIKKEHVPSTSTASDKVLYDEMDWVKIEPGTHTCVCYSLQDVDNVTMIFSSEEVIEHLSTITGFVNTDDKSYKPEEFEMCFVSFKGPDEEEASWYRAAVLEIDGDDYYVTFVDFGNQETVKSKDIRKFPASLKNIPILGTNCECNGIPNSPKILERMKELIPEGEEVEVVVKELKDLKYLIEIPDVYKKLKSERLY